MIRAIIIDDEPRAIELLQDYVIRYGSIELLDTFRDPLQALKFLGDSDVDLLFLDIDMPGLSGISLARLVPKEVKIIFTTAYTEYAVKSYDLEALDYLLKPISFERFIKAMQKVSKNPYNEFPASKDDRKKTIITLKSGFEIHRVLLDDIIYLKKDGNYMTYHLLEKKIVVRQNVQDAMSKLTDSFIQIHKSYIVSVPYIKVIDREGLHVENALLPIGKMYRDSLMERLG